MFNEVGALHLHQHDRHDFLRQQHVRHEASPWARRWTTRSTATPSTSSTGAALSLPNCVYSRASAIRKRPRSSQSLPFSWVTANCKSARAMGRDLCKSNRRARASSPRTSVALPLGIPTAEHTTHIISLRVCWNSTVSGPTPPHVLTARAIWSKIRTAAPLADILWQAEAAYGTVYGIKQPAATQVPRSGRASRAKRMAAAADRCRPI